MSSLWAISLLIGLISPTDLVSSHVSYLTVDGFDVTNRFVSSYVGYLTVDWFEVTNISCVKLCGLSHCWQVLCEAIGYVTVDGFEVTNRSFVKLCGLSHY